MIFYWSTVWGDAQVWTAHVHTKRALFAAISQQHNAAVQMADDECGNALACLQVGVHPGQLSYNSHAAVNCSGRFLLSASRRDRLGSANAHSNLTGQ